MEIERKFLISTIPFDLEHFPRKEIEQGYLSTQPVVRIRKEDADYILTYKSKGFMVREEYNLPLTKESYYHLKTKIDGLCITKTRYLIPYEQDLVIELDLFKDELFPLRLAEVEFSTKEEGERFIPPPWFGKEVTFSSEYHNSTLSAKNG